MIRVIGGSEKGRKLFSPAGLSVRPTTGRVKEFIFSYLGDRVEGSIICDLFSGSGSLGIEALSRGAVKVVFVEKSMDNFRLIKRNISLCGFEERTKIVVGDVFRELKRLGSSSTKYDIVLADPPFDLSLLERIIRSVESSQILKGDGLLVIEHMVHDTDSGKHSMRLIKQRRFGHCVVSIYH